MALCSLGGVFGAKNRLGGSPSELVPPWGGAGHFGPVIGRVGVVERGVGVERERVFQTGGGAVRGQGVVPADIGHQMDVAQMPGMNKRVF